MGALIFNKKGFADAKPFCMFNLQPFCLVYDPSVCGYSNHTPRNKLAACHKSLLYSVLYTAAAGNLHTNYGHALYIIVRYDCGQLFGIVNAVKLWTADKRNVLAHKFIMEISIGICGAICRYEKICTVKIRCVYGHKLDLNGPL